MYQKNPIYCECFFSTQFNPIEKALMMFLYMECPKKRRFFFGLDMSGLREWGLRIICGRRQNWWQRFPAYSKNCSWFNPDRSLFYIQIPSRLLSQVATIIIQIYPHFIPVYPCCTVFFQLPLIIFHLKFEIHMFLATSQWYPMWFRLVALVIASQIIIFPYGELIESPYVPLVKSQLSREVKSPYFLLVKSPFPWMNQPLSMVKSHHCPWWNHRFSFVKITLFLR